MFNRKEQTLVTPVIMFLMRDLSVNTEVFCFVAPKCILKWMNLPIFFFCCNFLIWSSMGMCLKFLVISPLGPFTFTYLALMVTVTTEWVKQMVGVTIIGNLKPLLCQYLPHIAISSLLINNNPIPSLTLLFITI